MDTARRYPPNAVHVQPAPPMDGPPVNAHFRCHLYTITNVELVPVQNIIITSSTDCSIRVWTISGTYIGRWSCDMCNILIVGLFVRQKGNYIIYLDVIFSRSSCSDIKFPIALSNCGNICHILQKDYFGLNYKWTKKEIISV